jgi:predicted nucleotidyltransferase
MNLLEAYHSVCRWPSPHTRDWLTLFLERAEADENVVAVIVIGSAIRPEVVSDDLDLMVLCRDVARLREKAPIEIDLRKADLHCVEEKIRAGHDLLIWAVRFGLPLLDKDGVWAGITRRWTNRLPVPDPTVALERAEAARKRMEKMRAIGDDEAFTELEVSYHTHRARASLAMAGVQPASRPELSGQLLGLGETKLAVDLEGALSRRMRGVTAHRWSASRLRPARPLRPDDDADQSGGAVANRAR